LVDTDRKADTVSIMDEGKRSKRSRRTFTDEFKAGAVRLVLDEGKTIPKVAPDLDLTESALRTWVERTRADRSHVRYVEAGRAQWAPFVVRQTLRVL
jgi:transposase